MIGSFWTSKLHLEATCVKPDIWKPNPKSRLDAPLLVGPGTDPTRHLSPQQRSSWTPTWQSVRRDARDDRLSRRPCLSSPRIPDSPRFSCSLPSSVGSPLHGTHASPADGIPTPALHNHCSLLLRHLHSQTYASRASTITSARWVASILSLSHPVNHPKRLVIAHLGWIRLLFRDAINLQVPVFWSSQLVKWFHGDFVSWVWVIDRVCFDSCAIGGVVRPNPLFLFFLGGEMNLLTPYSLKWQDFTKLVGILKAEP